MRSKRLQGLERAAFSKLITSTFLSKVGDSIHELIFVVTVLRVTSSLPETGMVYFLRFIPFLAFGPIGGALADRFSRKTLMIAADLARAAIVAVFVAVLALNNVQVGSLVLIGMLMTIFRTVFQPAFQSTIPDVIEPEQLAMANGASQVAAEIGGLSGPAVAGGLLALGVGSSWILAIDGASFVISAGLIARLQISPLPHPAATLSCNPGSPSLFREFSRNLVDVISSRNLFLVIGTSSVCILFVGAALRILIPAMLKHQGFSDSELGYAISAIAVGAVIGVYLSNMIIHTHTVRILMFSWCLYGVALSMLPLCIGGVVWAIIGCMIFGAVGSAVDIALPTNIQNLSTRENMGRNFGAFSTIANTGEALSGVFAGLLTAILPVGVCVTMVGLLVASTAYAGKLRSEAPE